MTSLLYLSIGSIHVTGDESWGRVQEFFFGGNLNVLKFWSIFREGFRYFSRIGGGSGFFLRLEGVRVVLLGLRGANLPPDYPHLHV
jgi:hypothetical protein